MPCHRLQQSVSESAAYLRSPSLAIGLVPFLHTKMFRMPIIELHASRMPRFSTATLPLGYESNDTRKSILIELGQ